MKVACIQMDVLHCRKQENLEKALYMALKAVEKGAELIVFPEVFSTGFCYENFSHAAESLPSPTLENLACFSEANDCIILGSIIQMDRGEDSGEYGFKNGEKVSSGKDIPESKNFAESKNSALYYNLGFCFESGNLAGTYRKTHPFKAENRYFSKGSSIEPISLKKQSLKIGFEICYELRFPEVARKLSLAGSDLLVTTAAFPNPRSEHWKTLAKARAIENQIPHIACNRIGSAPDCNYFGNSMIIDAWGEVKADAGSKECVIVCDLDLEGKEDIRKAIPIFEDRRMELY
ncbi:carbon-nitrogen hydrolase [Methanosarcina sp. 2.H.T.1A.6]|uniref:nitrilase-related carbon-nitrogen hydrolase n=1 Tax=unclassified Methanosarcina TaxID=2644672 RepID=UPI00062172C2|nr:MULTISPECIES: nitrilase-related carbon-nitrogen hydrolase [unclassified Methanosarcina]KKG15835.1 carbon-nitrogen hydrolase [Methanosarcina sp. 2.H.T.1A.3]KKG20225.1 carbon-nitrogen hydrolase [Methanosarcina sp. 2.H.T.1A.6]KKG25849.1 carbon-nitrogen hydrolase [Methanosarcina sp. 2.H.T.1A.15]KKG26683.1 carbon-nitrogen hydrolase [Methanosarcina sp. 2.H.T.1A.8]